MPRRAVRVTRRSCGLLVEYVYGQQSAGRALMRGERISHEAATAARRETRPGVRVNAARRRDGTYGSETKLR